MSLRLGNANLEAEGGNNILVKVCQLEEALICGCGWNFCIHELV